MSHYSGSVPDPERTPNWLDASACSQPGVDPDLFHANESDTRALREARAICAGCPSRVPCLTNAYEQYDQWGIHAGLTHRQRNTYLKKAGGNITRAVADALSDTRVLLKNLYWQHSEPRGRHRVWTDHRDIVTVRNVAYTISRLAWIALHGTDASGHVIRTCDVDGCIAEACLADRTARKAAAA
jgi:hypothetical protein